MSEIGCRGMGILFILITVFGLGACFVQAYTFADVKRLHVDLFNETTLTKHIRPIWNQTETLTVTMSLVLNAIDNVEMSTSQITVTGYLFTSWMDSNLAWNASYYGGISKITLPNDSYWKPGITVANNQGGEGKVGAMTFSSAFAFSNGLITWFPGGTFTSSCNMDTFLYPFDKHTCEIAFVSPDYDSSELLLASLKTEIDLSNFIDNGEWKVLESKALTQIYTDQESGLGISSVTYTMEIKRRPEFLMVHSYFPLTLLTMLSLVVPLTPADSGERITFSITVLLAFVFLTTSIVEDLPRNSLKIPLFSWEILMLNIINTLTTMWSVQMLVLCKRSEVIYPIPGRLETITLWLIKKRRKRCLRAGRRNNVIHVSPVENDVNDGIDLATLKPNNMHLGNNNFVNNDDEIDIKCTWKDVVESLDFIYFIITTFLWFIGFVVAFAIVAFGGGLG